MKEFIKQTIIKYKIYFLYLLIFLLVLVGILISEGFRKFLGIVSLAFVLSYILRPLKKFLESKGLKSSIAAVLSILFVAVIIVIASFSLFPIIINQSSNFVNNIEEFQNFFLEIHNKIKLQNNEIIGIFYEELILKVKLAVKELLASIANNIFKLTESGLSLFIIPFISYYFLADSKLICEKLTNCIPKTDRAKFLQIFSHIDKVLTKYIVSQLFIGFIISFSTFFVLIFLKIENSLILSIFNGFLNIIPYFGAIIGSLVIGLIVLSVSFKKAIIVLILLTLIQFLEASIITPKVIGHTVSVHPLFVTLLIILGSEIGGVIGMVVFVPIAIVVRVIYRDIHLIYIDTK